MTGDQLGLFNAAPPHFPRARRTDARSSHDAAARVERSGTAKADAAKLLDAVKRCPGLTSKELAIAAGVDRHAAGRRLPELAKLNLIRRVEPAPGDDIQWYPA